MQCFICVTYMIIMCSAYPPKTKEISSEQQKRSLFHDVIESLRIHTHLPEDNQNEENNLSQNYGYSYNEQPHLPSDAEFIPRRNDRLETPSLNYRFPKTLASNNVDKEKTKEEITIEIITEPQKQKTPKFGNKNRPFMKNREDTIIADATPNPMAMPMSNTMGGQSQIGHRESQTVVKPTIIVNLRGSVSHRDSDIKLEKRNNNTIPDIGRNIFNLKQEINLYAASTDTKHVNKRKPDTISQQVTIDTKSSKKVDEDMMMCETGVSDPRKTGQKGRKLDALQILFSI